MNELNFWSYFLSLNIIKSYPLFLNLLSSFLGIFGVAFNNGQDALLFKPLKPSEDQVLFLAPVVVLVVHVVALLQVKTQDERLGQDAVDESGDDDDEDRSNQEHLLELVLVVDDHGVGYGSSQSS